MLAFPRCEAVAWPSQLTEGKLNMRAWTRLPQGPRPWLPQDSTVGTAAPASWKRRHIARMLSFGKQEDYLNGDQNQRDHVECLGCVTLQQVLRWKNWHALEKHSRPCVELLVMLLVCFVSG